ncbi:transcriptional regulator NrdR [bacterium]|nr:transcriptional regulator NrdR [bacterium]
MRCPFCNQDNDRVIDSRPSKNGSVIRRRRECIHCERRFTTYEVIEEMDFMVVKKDDRRVPFDRRKVLDGMRKACEKRPIPVSILEGYVDEIEKILHHKPDKEITTFEIGEFVMDKLQKLDEVAFVRFASVYRQFKSVNDFMDEFNLFMNKKKSS